MARNAPLTGHGYFSIFVPPYILISMTLNTAGCSLVPKTFTRVASLPETYFITFPSPSSPLTYLLSFSLVLIFYRPLVVLSVQLTHLWGRQLFLDQLFWWIACHGDSRAMCPPERYLSYDLGSCISLLPMIRLTLWFFCLLSLLYFSELSCRYFPPFIVVQWNMKI